MHAQTITIGPTQWTFPSQCRILLVDDEPAILMPAARYFRRLAFRVDSAESKADALALISNHEYDAAILDLRLSHQGLEGLSLLEELRIHNPGIRVITFSGFVSGEAEAELWRQNVDAILLKPQPLADLAGMVIQLLEKGSGPPAPRSGA